jgi:hypothetical protein
MELQKWEYLVINMTYDPLKELWSARIAGKDVDLEKAFLELGDAGWEMVNYSSAPAVDQFGKAKMWWAVVAFKRPKE